MSTARHRCDDRPSPFAGSPGRVHRPPRTPRRRPRRTSDIALRDSIMREIVDPQKLLVAYHINEDAVRKTLSPQQMHELIGGLNVKLRASGTPRMGSREGVGPGAYDVSPPRSSVGPRWMPDTSPRSARGDVNKAITAVPGPGTYTADVLPHAPSAPRYSFGQRIEDKITIDAVRRPVPGPGAYSLPPVLGAGAGAGPAWSMQSRRPLEHLHDPHRTTPGPGAYVLTRSMLGDGTVRDWGAPHSAHSPRRPGRRTASRTAAEASPPSSSRKSASASPRARPQH